MNVAFLVLLMAPGQCGPGGCVVPQSGYYISQPQQVQQMNVYEWRKTTDPDQVALFRDGARAGTYHYSVKKYFNIDATRQDQGREPPITPPEKDGTNVGATDVSFPNYGIDLSKINRDKSYSVAGQATSKDEAFKRVEGSLNDDSKKNFLTVIGSKEDCERVKKDLEQHPALKEIAKNVHLHCYGPNDPMVQAGFVTNGSPTIYCQQAGSSKVLHRQDSYEGPEKLAEALRRADPKYNPAADPNLNDPLSSLKQIPPVFWLVAGIAALVFFSQKKDR